MRSIFKEIRIKNKITALLIVLFIGLTAFSSHAAEISSIKFNEIYEDNGIRMKLQGTGLKSVLFIRAFVAGYYSGTSDLTDPVGEFPKRIEVEYFVKIPAKKLNRFTIDQMKLNISESEFKNLDDQIKLMGQYFVDLKPGDRFALTYIPGTGTQFSHNGNLTGIIEGSEFAKALFSVWIGKKPFDINLKNQVLGLDQIALTKQDNNVFDSDIR